MRTPEEIAAIIDRYNLADRDALRELEAHIRRELPIREILLFADFLHCGIFISTTEPSTLNFLRKAANGEKVDIKWTRGTSGYVAQTSEEDTALTRLWEGLVRSAHLYIGAASILKMKDSRLLAGYVFADEGDGPTLYDCTLDELVCSVPKEYQKQLDAASKLDALMANVGNLPKKVKSAAKQGAKAGVEDTLPKVYAKAANMNAEELAKLSKPKTRSSGGGRKKERDLGDKQVKAALKYADNHPDIGLRAACDHIVRTMKGDDFKTPYTTAKGLDAAVRRYCKKTSRRIPSKTRSGRWSAKS